LEICRVVQFRRPIIRVRRNPRNIKLSEHCLDRWFIPGVMSELDSPSSSRRQLSQEASEPVVVADKIWRQLDEQGTEPPDSL
jgi:hypothetical protein